MNGKFSINRFRLGQTKFLLLSVFLLLGSLSCRQVVPPPPPVTRLPPVPIITERLMIPSGPSEEDTNKTARVILDIPPPVPVLPPMEGEVRVPLPEPWKIVVKKGQRKLYLYQQGELFKMFPVDLGGNPKGPKICQGDLRTPEGEYRVIEKKDRGQTRFYQAFLLNYPNDEDRVRYELAVRNGLLPKDIGIGGLIEIHGEGVGVDWTKGCIALNNPHMKELFNQIPVGTPVRIEP
ncbi:MAG: L,D-transpeptidase [Deltaproteobacteria bacterium]|nr:L,D-transpeptidase [Deltaproteobacteria bacterium]